MLPRPTAAPAVVIGAGGDTEVFFVRGVLLWGVIPSTRTRECQWSIRLFMIIANSPITIENLTRLQLLANAPLHHVKAANTRATSKKQVRKTKGVPFRRGALVNAYRSKVHRESDKGRTLHMKIRTIMTRLMTLHRLRRLTWMRSTGTIKGVLVWPPWGVVF